MKSLIALFTKQFVIALLLLCGLTRQSNAQWTLKDGPYGGGVNSLFADGTRLLAGTFGGGIFFSDDNGDNWKRSDSPNFFVTSFCKSGEIIFAGVYGEGIYKSTDHGATWVPAGSSTETVLSLLAIDGTIYAGRGDGIYRSIDQGETWTFILNSLYVNSLVQKDNSIFAASNSGIFISEDSGSNWILLTSTVLASHIVVAGDDLFTSDNVGVMYKSQDNGASWTNINFPNHISINAIHFFNNVLYAGTSGGGLYNSSDGGINWNWSSYGLSNYGIFSIAQINNVMFVGTGGAGVFKSNDGTSWTSATSGLSSSNVFALEKFGNNIFAAAFGNGISKSTDNGNSFGPISESTRGAFTACLESIDNYIFSGTNGDGVARSSDDGETWQYLNNSIYPRFVASLTASGTKLFAAAYQDGVFVSNDYATTWTVINNGLTNLYVYALASEGNNLFAGTLGDGVFISSDEGQNWTPINNGLTDLNINCLTIENNILYAGTANGIFKSSDYGNNWISISSGLTNSNITSLEVTEDHIFAADGFGLLVTRTNTISWDIIPQPSRNATIKSILANNGELLIGTYCGIFSTPIPNFPYISSVNPSSGYVGTTVTITGVNLGTLNSTISVSFNGVHAPITNSTPTSITVTVPVGATTGRISVTVDGRTKISSEFIVYTIEAPVATDATDVQSKQFTANWTSVAGVSFYQLDVSQDNFTSFVIGYKSRVVTSTSAIVSNLEPGINYQYRVRAVSNGISDYSNVISTSTLKLEQVISFSEMEPMPENIGVLNLNSYASTNSGLDLEFISSDLSVATISGNMLTVIGPGTTEITASQPGNATYEPATVVKQMLEVYSKVLSFSSEALVRDTIFFGDVPVGHVKEIKLSITNVGTVPLNISRVDYPAEFTGDLSSVQINRGESIDVKVAFVPFSQVVANGEILFNSDATSGPKKLVASGSGSIVLGLEESRNVFSVYPNPSNGNFYIKTNSSEEELANIKVLNSIGRTIKYSSMKDSYTGELLVDISNEAPGIYVIVVGGQIVKVLKI